MPASVGDAPRCMEWRSGYLADRPEPSGNGTWVSSVVSTVLTRRYIFTKSNASPAAFFGGPRGLYVIGFDCLGAMAESVVKTFKLRKFSGWRRTSLMYVKRA